MFTLLSGLWQWATSKDEVRVLVVGPSAAGKTTLLERVKRTYAPAYRGAAMPTPTPTIGMNLAKIPVNTRLDVLTWDVGGLMKPIWSRYFREADGVVFVADGTNADVAGQCDTLREMLTHDDFNEEATPVAIVINKVDVASTDQVTLLRLELEATARAVLGDPALPSAGGAGGADSGGDTAPWAMFATAARQAGDANGVRAAWEWTVRVAMATARRMEVGEGGGYASTATTTTTSTAVGGNGGGGHRDET